jgi:Ca2+-binding RTX toxin-like protein
MGIPVNKPMYEKLRGDVDDRLDSDTITFAIDVNPYNIGQAALVAVSGFFGAGKTDGLPVLVRTTPENKAQIREAFGLWNDLISRNIVEGGGEGADITVSTAANIKAASAGFTYSTITNPFVPDDADVFLRNDAIDRNQLGRDRERFGTAVHEIGHALGLEHPGNYNGAGGSYETSRIANEDTRLYSIMSYWQPFKFDAAANWYRGWDTAQTPMIYDILAIQEKYGADTNTRAGRTTYGFNSNAGRDVYDFNINKQPVLTIYDAGGRDRIDVSGFSNHQFIDLHQGSLSNIGTTTRYWDPKANSGSGGFYNGPVRDLIHNVGIAYGTDIEEAKGGSGDDRIVGNALDNSLYGSAGNDLIQSENGSDYLDGEAGNDVLDGAEDNDNLFGGKGDDQLFGAVGDDRLEGEAGNDVLVGGTGTNAISGGLGDDRFVSEAGSVNDVNGNAGNDWYVLGEGADTITDDSGYDTLEFTSYVFGDWQNGVWDGALITNDFWDPRQFEQYIGSTDGDVIVMNGAFATKFDMRGGGGSDTLAGGARKDQLWGDDGDDQLRGNAGNDSLNGGNGIDTAYFDDHFGKLGKGWDINLAIGKAVTELDKGSKKLGSALLIETDTLSGVENIVASKGNDIITGNSSNNVLSGLSGDDTVNFTYVTAKKGLSSGWTIDMQEGIATKTTQRVFKGKIINSVETDTLQSIENVIGSQKNDIIYSEEGPITGPLSLLVSVPMMDGAAGSDTLVLAQTIYSDLQRDLDADDTVTFSGANKGSVSTATFVKSGFGLARVIEPATGNINFQNIEVLNTGIGKDAVTGSAGIETVYLGEDDDTANLLAGNDVVFGENGNDTINGGGGSDSISGGLGSDILSGNAGADKFIYTTLSDGVDLISDFQASDTLVFTGVVFGGLNAGVLAAKNFWSAANGLAHDADDRFVYNSSDGSVWFDSDGNGNGEAILVADLTNNFALKAADILIV